MLFLRHQLEQNTAGIEEYIVLVVFVLKALHHRQPQLLGVEFYGSFDIVAYDRDLVDFVDHRISPHR